MRINSSIPVPATVLVLMALLLEGCAASRPRNPENLCEIFTENRGWYLSARGAARRWKGPIEVPMAIMYQESGFRANVRPPRRHLFGFIPLARPSSALGYAQAQTPAWKQYQKESGNGWAERDDFDDAIDFMQWYIDKSRRLNGVAKSDAYRQYLNYHEGWTGYKRGSYRGKATLEQVARRVAERSKRYAEQYAGCRKRLDRGRLRRLLFGAIPSRGLEVAGST